jgi:hypothetical protein
VINFQTTIWSFGNRWPILVKTQQELVIIDTSEENEFIRLEIIKLKGKKGKEKQINTTLSEQFLNQISKS